jgi:NAD(P)-dependent dehydrogenase (short-subunit alcohol dehydrogenase family)
MPKGKVTVVAGASGGIERAIGARFARKGATLVLVATAGRAVRGNGGTKDA